jgi:hypothetical protein
MILFYRTRKEEKACRAKPQRTQRKPSKPTSRSSLGQLRRANASLTTIRRVHRGSVVQIAENSTVLYGNPHGGEISWTHGVELRLRIAASGRRRRPLNCERHGDGRAVKREVTNQANRLHSGRSFDLFQQLGVLRALLWLPHRRHFEPRQRNAEQQPVSQIESWGYMLQGREAADHEAGAGQ